MTFVTKTSLVTLDKSHETLVPNDKVYWMKEKKSTNKSSSFDSIVHILCHMRL
jgi:hypothetical protein